MFKNRLCAIIKVEKRQRIYEMRDHKLPFYDVDISSSHESDHIKKVLKKYKNEPVGQKLKESVYNELHELKHQGVIKVPFKVVMRRDPEKKYPDYIEVILDTQL